MRSHSNDIRRKAISLWESGVNCSVISRQMGIDYDTLLGWVKRYRSKGFDGLLTDYSHCGRPIKFPEVIRERAIALRQANSQWGAGYICVQLRIEHPLELLPTVRQIQRWLRQAGLQVERTVLPRTKTEWVQKPFERVQVDAKERLKTQDGQECCYLNFTDEHTGAVLEAVVFPLRPHRSGSGQGSL
ncbi:MAG: helix-turn-helix domain containing protein [Saprospiraceae bacterium]|jgi:transposase|nr:helix-turn-helix domain containing protein [Saprospiraceae bacterium]